MGSREYFHRQSLVGRRAEVRVMARDTVRLGGGLASKEQQRIISPCLSRGRCLC